MSTIITELPGVVTSSPKLTEPESVEVTYNVAKPKQTLGAANRRLTAGYDAVIRKATENTRRLSGRDRF